MLNRRTKKTLGAAMLAAVVFAGGLDCAQADPYDKLSSQIAAVAKKSAHLRIAILPLKPINGRSRQGGMILAERLVSRLAGAAGIQVIERTLLEQVLKEQKLGTSGVLNQEEAKEVGRILGVDALVTGTYLPLAKNRLEVHTRLIDAESARILGVAQANVRKEWTDDAFALGEMWNIKAPDLGDFPAPMVKAFSDTSLLPGMRDLRDAPRASGPCDDWKGRIDELQAGVLEAKAKFWATRLADPSFDRRSVTRNPGTDIRNSELRGRFYDRTKALHRQGYSDGISMSETVTIENVKAQVDRLIDRCY